MTAIDDATPEAQNGTKKITFGRVLLAIVVAGSFGIWAYGFSGFAARTAPDTLANDSFLVLADPRCAAANDTVAAMPNAIDAQDNIERAVQVRNNTAVYAEMVSDLEDLLADPRVDLDERDTEITFLWLQDWQQFFADRLDYADRLEQDPAAVFYVAASSGGERLERRITRFANTNELYNCVTPSDVG